MGFLDQMKQGTQRAAWEAERMVRVNKANSAVSDARRELEMQTMNLGRAVLQIYDAGATPPDEVAPLYGQIKALGTKAQQLEAEVERIKAEQAPQVPPGTAQGYTPPLAPGYTPPAQGYAPPPPGYAPPPQGYAPPGYTSPDQGYAPPPQGYAPPPQGYASPNQGYAPPPQGYAPPPPQGYAPTGPAPYAPTGPAPYAPSGSTADDFSVQTPATATGYGAPAYDTAAAHTPASPPVPHAAGCPHCHAPRTDPTAVFCQECGSRYTES